MTDEPPAKKPRTTTEEPSAAPAPAAEPAPVAAETEAKETEEELFCVCKQPYDEKEFMVGCDGGCDGWYHPKCVNLTQQQAERLPARWSCPACVAAAEEARRKCACGARGVYRMSTTMENNCHDRESTTYGWICAARNKCFQWQNYYDIKWERGGWSASQEYEDECNRCGRPCVGETQWVISQE